MPHEHSPNARIERRNPCEGMLIGMLIGQFQPARTIETPAVAAPDKIDDVWVGRMHGKVMAVPGELHVWGSGSGNCEPGGGRRPCIIGAEDSNQISVAPSGAHTDIKSVRNIGRDGDADTPEVCGCDARPRAVDAGPIGAAIGRTIDSVGGRS